MVHSRVLQSLSAPILGHLDPLFLAVMDDIQHLLRKTFRTGNPFTIAVSGTGSAGMEAAITNLIEPGDTAIVGMNGVFGGRIAAMVERCGGTVIRLEMPWGSVIDPDMLREWLAKSQRVKAVALVHAETSTGAWQPLQEMAALCHNHGALLIVDAVTSLGGVPVEVDAWDIDICYSGTQKCLSCPPGLAPLTWNRRAMEAIKKRKRPCQSWYFDLALVSEYWTEGTRAYHHTAPISMSYGLREALRLVQEEGLETRFARHRTNSAALLSGLAELGLTPFPDPNHRLPMLNCVRLPRHVEDVSTRNRLLEEFGIEIGGGLGPLRGKVWRIGLMGESSQQTHVLTLLNALEDIFARSGWLSTPGIAIRAAVEGFHNPMGQ
jgi:alanine-glyoxylate transaminase/serine-glyoxylate transaminase/serine-pyruvate transaminase